MWSPHRKQPIALCVGVLEGRAVPLLSSTSQPAARMWRGNHDGEVRPGMGKGTTDNNGRGQALPDSCQVAVVVNNVKVRHSAVALLLARLVFKLLQRDALCVGVNA